MRLTGAFVTRFLEEWQHAQDAALHNWSSGDYASYGEERAVVERFLEAMKHELTAVLLPETSKEGDAMNAAMAEENENNPQLDADFS
jgi:hypothetical protein